MYKTQTKNLKTKKQKNKRTLNVLVSLTGTLFQIGLTQKHNQNMVPWGIGKIVALKEGIGRTGKDLATIGQDRRNL